MISVYLRQGMQAIGLPLIMTTLSILSGCAQQRKHTYHAAHEGPVIRIQILDSEDVITIRPTSVNVTANRNRHYVSIRYDIAKQSAIPTSNSFARSVYMVESQHIYQFLADGKHKLVHQYESKDVWIHPAPPSIKSAGVDLQGRMIMDASVSLMGWYVYRGDIKSFDMTLDLDGIRVCAASVYSLSSDRVSVVASEPEARWTFVRDQSR